MTDICTLSANTIVYMPFWIHLVLSEANYMDFYIYVLLATIFVLSLWWSLLIISGLKDKSARKQ